ncbi:MAG: hypothetical protein U9R26_11040 [Campylobacterota bacterium]|nr:hypothetical protein [Campylobacterota bacterium]
MFRELLLIGLIILFAGCSSKDENRMDRSFVKIRDFGEGMQKTENIKLSQDGEVKIFLTATYLNGEESIVDEDNKIKEKFIIGFYQADDVNFTGLINPDQNLTINIKYQKSDKEYTRAEKIERKKGVDKLPVAVKKLSLNDPLLKYIPLVNTWNNYYYVEFPHTERKTFALTYQNKVYGKKKKKKNKKEKKTTKGDAKAKQEKKKDEKIKKQEYKKYKLNFSKKAKYLYQKSKKLF